MLEPRAAPEPGGAQAVLHGLYWLAANLSTRAPLMLVMDDLHWGDVPSLEWLRVSGPPS